jgi:hypothetical protein
MEYKNNKKEKEKEKEKKYTELKTTIDPNFTIINSKSHFIINNF